MQILAAEANQGSIEMTAGVGRDGRVEEGYRVVERGGNLELAYDGGRGREQRQVCSLSDLRVDAASVKFQMQLVEAAAKPEQRKSRLTETPGDGPGGSAREDFNMRGARVSNGSGDEFTSNLSVLGL
ncbi:hypothetical protein VHAB30_07210 [Variovorax boronicumulans]|nr:hypothetical protein VHAB30_07210 [Variovorax boronicumulans]